MPVLDDVLKIFKLDFYSSQSGTRKSQFQFSYYVRKLSKKADKTKSQKLEAVDIEKEKEIIKARALYEKLLAEADVKAKDKAKTIEIDDQIDQLFLDVQAE